MQAFSCSLPISLYCLRWVLRLMFFFFSLSRLTSFPCTSLICAFSGSFIWFSHCQIPSKPPRLSPHCWSPAQMGCVWIVSHLWGADPPPRARCVVLHYSWIPFNNKGTPPFTKKSEYSWSLPTCFTLTHTTCTCSCTSILGIVIFCAFLVLSLKIKHAVHGSLALVCFRKKRWDLLDIILYAFSQYHSQKYAFWLA